MTSSVASERDPVTVVVSRRARRGREDELERWLHDVIAATARFEGYQGSTVLRPEVGSGLDHVLVFRFASARHLHAWQTSEERTQWLARAEPFTEMVEVRTQQGLEPFFDLPAPRVRGAAPPPRWKMAILTWIGLYPLVVGVGILTEPLLRDLPFALAVAPQTVATVALMAWGMMPLLTRLAARWLYPVETPSRS
ncbi:MAG: antibiotic biosynthesis monooxygenase [Deltaproteobacteria bacterium]|nr:antibiotic biosynthesis monooxygenase [Deltaproteobacteria bacterium]